MSILSRYISRTVIMAIFMITLILTGIEILFTFIGELNNIGTGNYGALNAFIYVMLDMPYQLTALLPMAGLVGCLVGLGILANQSELIVLRAAGFSTGQICRAVLLTALLVVIVTTLLGEVIAPHAENLATNGRAIAKSGGQALATKRGAWIRFHSGDSNQFIYIRNVISSEKLDGVTVYQFDNNELKRAISAETADLQQNSWQLHQAKITDIAKDKRVVSYEQDNLPWNVRLDPNLLSISDGDPRNMTLKELHTYISYLQTNGLRATSYQLSFWKRIFQPLATLVMIFLAVPFIFGPLRTVTMGLRILAGISVGFCFFILNQFFGPLSTLFQLPPIIGASLPTLLFIFAGLGLLQRVR